MERTLEQLEHDICQGAANLAAAEHAWLLLVAEFDRREGYVSWECTCTARWLAWQVGLDIRAAHEKVRVARALEHFPLISQHMAAGQLSYSKVRAITRIATNETEEALVDMALMGTSNHVERIVSAYRRADDVANAIEQRQHERRGFHHYFEDDGALVIKVRLAAEPGMAVLAALEQFTAAPTRDGDPLAERRADALVDMADHAAKPGRNGDYLVTLHVGDGRQEVTTASESIDPVGVSHETARRIACDAIFENKYDLGRRARVVRGKLRRAVQLRDGGCRFPGCTYRSRIHAHHIEHWPDGGPTDLANLVSLCRWHHRRVHEGGWTIRVDNDTLAFVSQHGFVVAESPIPLTGDPNHVSTCRRTASDARCRWLGESLSVDLALTALFSRAERGP